MAPYAAVQLLGAVLTVEVDHSSKGVEVDVHGAAPSGSSGVVMGEESASARVIRPGGTNP